MGCTGAFRVHALISHASSQLHQLVKRHAWIVIAPCSAATDLLSMAERVPEALFLMKRRNVNAPRLSWHVQWLTLVWYPTILGYILFRNGTAFFFFYESIRCTNPFRSPSCIIRHTFYSVPANKLQNCKLHLHLLDPRLPLAWANLLMVLMCN